MGKEVGMEEESKLKQPNSSEVEGKDKESKTKGKTTKSNRKRDQKGEASTDGKKVYRNDPAWYYLDQTVADQTTAYSFDQFIGRPFDVNFMNSDISTEIGGILTIGLAPSAGDTSSLSTGINMAALRNFTMLTSNNAKSTRYAPQDLTTLILALGSLVSQIEHIRRAFGLYLYYNQRNRLVPRALWEAMYIDPDDFVTNMANYRNDFNELITSFNQISFPSNISYIFKCSMLYQGIYADSDSSMAQLYLFHPVLAWKFNEKYNDNGTGLDTVDLSKLTKMSELLQTARDCVRELLESSTLSYVYADILRFCQSQKLPLLNMDYLVDGYLIEPVVNEGILYQIQNSTITGGPSKNDVEGYTHFNDVSADASKNRIVYNPNFQARTITTPIVNFPTPEADVNQRIEFTRYLSVLDGNSSGPATEVILPDHYIVKVKVVRSNINDEITSNVYVSTTTSGANIKNTRLMLALSQFKTYPMIYYRSQVTGESVYSMHINSDLNYFTTLDKRYLKRLNDIIYIGLFSMR